MPFWYISSYIICSVSFTYYITVIVKIPVNRVSIESVIEVMKLLTLASLYVRFIAHDFHQLMLSNKLDRSFYKSLI